MAFGEEALKLICAYGPQSEKPFIKKQRFYDELVLVPVLR